uniref:Uncharacterized protein n=1 Tax=Oryza brachyantha TaxID=4533 RepID=J3LQT5_ORYBR
MTVRPKRPIIGEETEENEFRVFKRVCVLQCNAVSLPSWTHIASKDWKKPKNIVLEHDNLFESTAALQPGKQLPNASTEQDEVTGLLYQRVRLSPAPKICMDSYSTGFEAKILQTGMVSFLLSNFKVGWTGMSFIDTLSPMSRFARSTSIFGGMCSAGQRYTKLVLIFCKKPPTFFD